MRWYIRLRVQRLLNKYRSAINSFTFFFDFFICLYAYFHFYFRNIAFDVQLNQPQWMQTKWIRSGEKSIKIHILYRLKLLIIFVVVCVSSSVFFFQHLNRQFVCSYCVIWIAMFVGANSNGEEKLMKSLEKNLWNVELFNLCVCLCVCMHFYDVRICTSICNASRNITNFFTGSWKVQHTNYQPNETKIRF